MSKRPAYEAIFFDMDGTLFDLSACERETVRALLSQSAPSLAPPDSEQFLDTYAALSPGRWASGLAANASREEIVEGIFAAVCARPGLDLISLAGVADRYWQLFAGVAVLEPGAAETLARLARRYRLGVISNGYADTQRPRLAAAGLSDWFQTIVVSGEVGWAKPDPRIFAHGLAQLNVAPSVALYVGDSLSHDLAGALAAGLDFCLYRPKGGKGVALPPGTRLVTALPQLAGDLA
ncbi:MAG: HAD-IA family hydrolase [Caldilineaceae bacterium]